MSSAWGKLISINRRSLTDDFELTTDEVKVGRAEGNQVRIDNPKVSKVHCIITKEGSDIFIEDKSSNGTYIQDTIIGKDKKQKLNPGDIVYLLHKDKIKGKCEDVGLVFSLVNIPTTAMQIEPDEKFNQEIDKIKEKLKKEREQKVQQAEDYKCSICQELIHDYAQLNCCIHGFCGGCLSEYLLTNQTCPDCRQPISSALKNAKTNSTIEQLKKGNNSLKRNIEEYEELDLKNVVTSISTDVNKLIKLMRDKQNSSGYQTKLADIQERLRKRIMGEIDSDYSYQSDNEDEEEQKLNAVECPECKIQRQEDSFKCGDSQQHLDCTGCKRKFPSRPEKQNQRCVLCKHPYCGLYLGVCKNYSSTQKKDKYLAKFSDFKAPNNIAQNIFRNNKTEIQIINDYLKSNHLTTQSILDDMNQNFISKNQFSFEKSRSILPNYTNAPSSTPIHLDSPVCSECFPVIWYQIVFRYRIYIRNKLPSKYANRGYCHWGINCTTQTTKQSHAETYDHVCEQSRF